MTAPMPQLPNVKLGNIASDIGSGASTFVRGLLEQRQRQQQMALQEALASSRMQQEGAQTTDISAQAAGREHENLPAGHDQFLQLQSIEPGASPSWLEGSTRKEADALIQRTIMRRALLDQRQFTMQSRVLMGYDPQGNAVLIRPNAPGGPQQTPLGGGVGRPTTEQERKQAGLAGAAMAGHQDLTQIENSPNGLQVMSEAARALQGPALARLAPFIGQGMEEALSQLRLVGLSPQAEQYVKRLYDFASLVAPERYGRQFRNPAILHQAWTDFGAGQFGIDQHGIQSTQRNRLLGVQQLQTAAGPRAMGIAGQTFQQPSGQAQPQPSSDPYNQYDTPRP